MTTYLRWTAMTGWATLMAILWALFVPRGLSVVTFTMLALTGPLCLVVWSALWRSQQPSASVGKILADLEAPRAATRESR